MNCLQAIITILLLCLFSLEVSANSLGLYLFDKIDVEPGEYIVKETNATCYPDDISGRCRRCHLPARRRRELTG